jgi:hypothetical protein
MTRSLLLSQSYDAGDSLANAFSRGDYHYFEAIPRDAKAPAENPWVRIASSVQSWGRTY